MPDLSLSRRLLRRLAVPALLLAAAAPVRTAHAQPACIAGSLASYLAVGSCTLGGWVFSGFSYDDDRVSQNGFVGTAGTPASIMLSPFTGASGGRPSFGFDFSGFTTTLTTQPTLGDETYGYGYGKLLFSLAPVMPGSSLYSASATTTAVVTTTNDDDVYSDAEATIDMTRPGQTTNQCLEVSEIYPSFLGDVGRTATQSALCAPDVGALDVKIALYTEGATELPPAPGASGSGIASVSRLGFVANGSVATVPEPATVALVGIGLASLGVTGAARRRRSR